MVLTAAAATALSGGLSGLGSLGSGFLGFLGSNASARKQYKYQSALQAQAAQLNYDYGIKSLKNSPSAQREGLESAGYNPMLAVQNATSGANSGWTTTGQAQNVDYGQVLSNAFDFKRLQNETATAESTQDFNYANADKIKAEKASIIERLPWVSKQAKADYMKTEMESAKLENDIHYQNEYLNYLDNSLKLQQRLGEMGINVQNYANDINAYNAVTSRYKRTGGLKILGTGVDESRFISPELEKKYNLYNNPERHYSSWESKYW